MKKIRNLVLLLAFFIFFNGCERNQIEDSFLPPDDEFTIEKAKAFIGSQSINQYFLKAGHLDKPTISIMPDWSKVKSSSNKKVQVFEIELLSSMGFGIATKQNYLEYAKQGDSKYLNSLVRLVIKQNKATKETMSFIMTIVGNKEYLVKQGFKLDKNSYLDIEKDFNGQVLFHNLSGNYVNGFIYTNGVITHTISNSTKIDIDLQLKSANTFFCEQISNFFYTSEEIWQTAYSNGLQPITSYLYTRVNSYEYTVNVCGIDTDFTYSGAAGDNPALDPYNYVPVPIPAPVVDADDLKENLKADCIYQKLLNGGIMSSFISRYFGITAANQSFLGELNLTWKLGNSTEILPIGIPRNGTYYSVEIRLNENVINTTSSTNVALSMLHEALHAKLIAEVYDEVGTTDFKSLLSYYQSWRKLDIDQEKIMLENYFEALATGLNQFDQSQGIYRSLEFYKKAVRYDLNYEIYGKGSSQDDYNAFNEMFNSSRNCN